MHAFFVIVIGLLAAALGEGGKDPKFVHTWVFGKQRYMDAFIEDLDINPDISSGFIQLIGDRKSLTIAMVQRPKFWPSAEKFCSPILRAAVKEFFTKTFIEVNDVESIHVKNMGTPKEAGCRCYVGLMVEMGFQRINDLEDIGPDDVSQFCSDANFTFISGRTVNIKPSLPIVDQKAQEALESAFFDEWILDTP